MTGVVDEHELAAGMSPPVAPRGSDPPARCDLGLVLLQEALGPVDESAHLSIGHAVESLASLGARFHEAAPHQARHVFGDPPLGRPQAPDDLHLMQLPLLQQQLEDPEPGGVPERPE